MTPEYQRAWRKKNQERYREQNRKYSAKWRKEHPEETKIHNKRGAERYRTKIKLEVLSHYSTNPPQCANPFGLHKEPFVDIDCLSLDHITGGHRRNASKWGRGGQITYRILKKESYPSGWQVLCMNCQFKKIKANKEW